jgi:hypothetical protein
MNQELKMMDAAFVTAAPEIKPIMHNLEVLKCTGCIPDDWEPAQAPVCHNNFAQIVFKNGIVLNAEVGRLTLIEPLADKSVLDLQIPQITRQYAQIFSNIEFEAISINLRSYVPFSDSQESAREYMTQNLLSPGAWQEEGEEPVRASFNLVYKYKRAPFYLNITEAALRKEEDEINIPIVMFGGSFSYGLSGLSDAEKTGKLQECIDNWQLDLETFQQLVTKKFLGQSAVYSPAVSDLFNMKTPVGVA